MGLNDKLLPEQRADRNGVVSTKWVRPTGEPAVRGYDFPQAPAPASFTEHEQRLAAAVETLDLFEAPATLKRLSNRVLDDLTGVCGGNEQRSAFLLRCVEYDEPESFIDDYLHLVDYFDAENFPSSDAAFSSVRSLCAYDFLSEAKRDEPYPEQRRKQCIALIRGTDALERLVVANKLPSDTVEAQFLDFDPMDYVRITDGDLARFFADHPDDTDAIIKTIEQRLSTDTSMLLAVIGHGTRAVSEGVL